jgi:hypothetical protein
MDQAIGNGHRRQPKALLLSLLFCSALLGWSRIPDLDPHVVVAVQGDPPARQQNVTGEDPQALPSAADVPVVVDLAHVSDACTVRDGYWDEYPTQASNNTRMSLHDLVAHSVAHLVDDEFGQTCNAIQIICAAIEETRQARLSVLALGAWYSRHLRALDLATLTTYTNLTFLLDCKSLNRSLLNCPFAIGPGPPGGTRFPGPSHWIAPRLLLQPNEIFHSARRWVGGGVGGWVGGWVD